jgi:hypothetical protein
MTLAPCKSGMAAGYQATKSLLRILLPVVLRMGNAVKPDGADLAIFLSSPIMQLPANINR